MALMLVNWGFEALKWQLLVRSIEKISFLMALRAIFSGQALAFNTINRIGEPAGRAIFLQEGNRIRGIFLSFVAGISQTVVTLLLGLIALIFLRVHILDATHHWDALSGPWLDILTYGVALGLVIYLLLYYKMPWMIHLLERIPILARYKFFVEKLEELHWKELTKILFLSACRYIVFVSQYILLLQVFGVAIFWTDAAGLVCVMLLVLAIIPTVALAELGFRGKLGIQLFGLLSSNTVGIVATAAGIWIINLVIPAIVGSLFILGVRLFRNK